MVSINRTVFFLTFFNYSRRGMHIFSAKETIAEENYHISSAIVLKAGEKSLINFLGSSFIVSLIFFIYF